MIVDTHHHWVPPTMAGAIDRRAGENPTAAMLQGAGRVFPGMFDLALHTEELAAAGATAVVSILPPGPDLVGGAEAVAFARGCNDELLAAVHDRPELDRALLSLPLPDVEASLAELERVGADAAVGGVMLFTVGADWTLDQARFEPVYRAIAQRGLPLLLHPASEPPPPALRDFRLADSLGAMFSSTTGAARFLLSGMLDRVPDLVVIIPHLGGTLPYLAQRLVDQNGRGDAEHDVLHYLQHRTYLDSCSFHPPALRCALDTVGVDRLLLGSDYPFRGAVARAVADIEDGPLPEGGAALVLGENVQRLWAGIAVAA
jgi:aminocarboxymuconate-semialdehyde decarboxylase